MPVALIANRPVRIWTDMDTDRFSAQAQYLGELFRVERNGNASDADLSPEKRRRSQEIAADLRRYLAGLDDDTQVLEAAMRLLARELHIGKDN